MDKDRKPYADFVYNVDKLNVIFAAASVALILAVGWMIWDDYDREWKDQQRHANALEIHKTQADLKGAQQEIDQEQLAQIEADISGVERTLGEHQTEYDLAVSTLENLDGEWYAADQNLRTAKAKYEAIKYQYEDAVHARRQETAAERKKALDSMASQIDRLRQALERVEAKQLAQKDVIDGLAGRRVQLEKQRDALLNRSHLLQRRLEKILPSLVNRIRNLPMVDFVDPSIRVQQIVLGDVRNDLNFTQIPKVDRCTTCHVNIDRAGYEIDLKTGQFKDPGLKAYIEATYSDDERIGRSKVFATHPKLDLFAGSSSPHPMERVGCTSCHRGRDRGTTFTSSAHTPGDDTEAQRWLKQYGWHEMHHWEEPMLPLHYVEASCAQCHKGVQEVPEADRLNRGVRLVKYLGCQGCHKIEGYNDLRKVGPDLRKIAGKLDREWTTKWVRDPMHFRPSTTMPKTFDLQNLDSPRDKELSTAAVHGAVTYLFEKSGRPTYPDPPVAGDPVRGELLTAKVGCRGCHVVGTGDRVADSRGLRSFGPELNGIGSKVGAGWLYAWVKEPEVYFPETTMPDLRLTDQEAADITAYLLTLRNQDFEAQAVPPLDRNARDELILEYLQSRLSEAAAKDRLAAMSELEGDLYLGQKIILRQGCFGCHLIPGFEQMQPIGTELTAEGEKDVGRLDFGLNPLGIPHSRQAWFYTKLQQPRVFDLLHLEGGPDRVRVKEYDEKLRMPDFRLTDEDAHAVTTALLSFRKSTVTQEAVRHLTPHEQDIERGRELMHQHNCQGCHVVEGGGGAIRETLTSVYVDERAISPAEASGFVPPTLDGEGEKVQPDWLFGFLRNPDVIRPWLEVRMPSFGFDDQDAIDITTYFSRLDRQKFPYHTFVDKHLSRNNIRGAELLFSGEVYDCWTCHQQGDIPPKGDPASWAPDLKLARERLRPGWTARWLWDPQQVQPGTKMPTFFGEEMTYLPEALAEDLDLPEGTSPEDGVLILPARQVVEALNDYMVYGLHQSRPLTKK